MFTPRRLRDVFNERGNVAIIVAIFAPVAAVLAALAVDTGAIAYKQRQMQGLADIAAMTAAQDIDNAEHVARMTLAMNGFAGAGQTEVESGTLSDELDATYDERVRVETGQYVSDRKQAFRKRFVAGALPANAVRVVLSDAEPKYFSVLLGRQAAISVTGTAAASSEVAFSIGSRLVSLEDGLANQLLSALTGTEISLTVMDYRGLVRADIDLLKVFDTLATDASLNAASYQDVLDADVTMSDLLSAMAKSGDTTSRDAATLRALAGERDLADITVSLAALVDLGPLAQARLGTPTKGLETQVSAMQMLTAAAAISNGDRQVELDIEHGLPGLASIRAALEIGERPQTSPWFSVSRERQSVVSTAQARLFLEIRIDGRGLLARDLVRLPLYLELAPADARVSRVFCESGAVRPRRVDIDVRPGIANLRIADLEDELSAAGKAQAFRPAEILDTRLLRIRASAHSSASSSKAQTLRFHESAISRGEPLTARTHNALGHALGSAVRDLDLEVEIAGLSLVSPDAVQRMAGLILEDAIEPVDGLVMDIANALGLSIGEADVWVHGARCNRSVLVQ